MREMLIRTIQDHTKVATIIELENGVYYFEYNEIWQKNGFYLDPSIPLGFFGILDDWQLETFTSKIPDRKNLFYTKWCEKWGIAIQEKDTMTLLTTVAARWAYSCFENIPVNFTPGVWSKGETSVMTLFSEHNGVRPV